MIWLLVVIGVVGIITALLVVEPISYPKGRHRAPRSRQR